MTVLLLQRILVPKTPEEFLKFPSKCTLKVIGATRGLVLSHICPPPRLTQKLGSCWMVSTVSITRALKVRGRGLR